MVVEVGVGVVIWFHQVLYNGEGLYSKHHLPKAAEVATDQFNVTRLIQAIPCHPPACRTVRKNREGKCLDCVSGWQAAEERERQG